MNDVTSKQLGPYQYQHTEAIIDHLLKGETDLETVFMTKKIGDDLGATHPLRQGNGEEIYQSLSEALSIVYRENIRRIKGVSF